jgi:hypothetical protein
MDKSPSASAPFSPKKIYVTLVGAAPMASLDALMISLERFKSILSSDSAKERFETSMRTIKSSPSEVNQFIDAVYSEKNPKMSVSSPGRTLIIEVSLSKDKFLDCIDSEKVSEILTHVVAVGTMPVKRDSMQPIREYIVFPVKYEKGRFIKV